MSRLIALLVFFAVFPVISGLSSAQQMPPVDPLIDQNLTASLPSGTVLLEGDIVVPEDYFHGRAAYQTWYWPGGVVYYQFASYISTTNRSRMRAAMDELETTANLSFVPRTAQSNYISIIEAGGNWSNVGMIGGMQELSIYNWTYKYIIIHELMHALGLWHEQSRTDRDNYITINYANIIAGKEHNFNIRASSPTYGAYDFCSVMHYDRFAFSANSLATISAKPAYAASASCMGNRSYMTTQDKASVAYMYPPLSTVPGDRPATALEVTGGIYNHSAASSQFTVSSDEPGFACSSSGLPVGNTVWYKITPAKERYIDIFVGGYDTVLAVYTGSPSSLFMETCVDYHGSQTDEWIGLPLRAGTTYYIGVGGWNGSGGTLALTVHSLRNVVTDGSFDWGTSAWKQVSGPSNRVDDKHKCARSGVFNSLCSLMFKGGAGENTKFTQTILPDTISGGWNFSAGNYFWLSYMVKSKVASNKTMLHAIFVFTDGTKQKLAVSIVGSTGGFYYFANTYQQLQRSDVKKVIVRIINKTANGKTWVDNVTLVGEIGFDLRASQQRGVAPTKPQSFAPVVNQRDTQSAPAAVDTVLPLPPPSN